MRLVRLNESNYKEFSRQDYQEFSCGKFPDGSNPLIHKSKNGTVVICFPTDPGRYVKDNVAVEIHFYSNELDEDYVWTTRREMTKEEALEEFEDIIEDVDKAHGYASEVEEQLHKVGKKYRMSYQRISF